MMDIGEKAKEHLTLLVGKEVKAVGLLYLREEGVKEATAVNGAIIELDTGERIRIRAGAISPFYQMTGLGHEAPPPNRYKSLLVTNSE